MRRVVLIAIALGIPLLWALAPNGRMPPPFGFDEPGRAKTFAGTLAETVREASDGFGPLRLDTETAIKLAAFPGLLAPLYPAVVALLLLAAPRWCAARRRWAWILEGVIVLLLTPIGGFWALFSLLILIPGAGSPPLYPTRWLLPGGAALAAIAAIWIGIARRGRIARFVLDLSKPADRL